VVLTWHEFCCWEECIQLVFPLLEKLLSSDLAMQLQLIYQQLQHEKEEERSNRAWCRMAAATQDNQQ
jgi:hypothetical protein